MRRSRGIVEVIPFVALPPGTEHRFTYRVPDDTAVRVGSRVHIPFGSRVVEGIVWSLSGRPRPGLKFLDRVVSGPLLFPRETHWLERLAELSLESLALLVKSLVSVRKPLGALPLVSVPRTAGRASVVHCAWTDDILSFLAEAKEHQLLVLVPELAIAERILTTCMRSGIPVQRFSQALRLTERRRVLEALVARRPGVVVATHSGVFLPFTTLQSIIIAESALPSHRQWDLHPRYDARIAALLRARTLGVPVRFLSSLPSADLQALGSKSVTVSGSLPPLSGRILRRYGEGQHPLLPDVEQEIRERLTRRRPMFLFQNVVGAERQYVCSACGFAFRCELCGGMLQRSTGHLVCRECRSVAGPVRSFCPRCGSPRVHPRRVGTGALEEVLRKTFPNASVLRLDRESVPRSLQEIRTGDTPTLVVGTERAFAVLPERIFALSVVVDGDALLTSPAFDTAETALRLITRVAALTDPPHERTLTIQTTMPDFPLFRALAEGHIDAWIAAELGDRRTLRFPPYAAMLHCTRQFSEFSRAEKDTASLVQQFRKRGHLRVGWRIPRETRGFRGDIIARGSRDALWKVLPALPRSWTVDPLIPLRELL